MGIPAEPGHYWWMDDGGDIHVAEFDADMECFHCDNYGYDYLTVSEFMDMIVFGQWLGKVVLPRVN